MIFRQKQFQPAGYGTGAIATATLRETLYDLYKRGYQLKFRREGTLLYCVELDSWFIPDSFTIDEYYHFEAGPERYDDRMLYAISSRQGIKGFLTDTCFMRTGNASTEIVERPDWEYMPAGVF